MTTRDARSERTVLVTMCVGYFLVGIGSLGCALAPNVGALVAGRAVQGLGSGASERPRVSLPI